MARNLNFSKLLDMGIIGIRTSEGHSTERDSHYNPKNELIPIFSYIGHFPFALYNSTFTFLNKLVVSIFNHGVKTC